MQRAYSLLTVKTVEDGKRIIRGVATSPAVDRVGDVIDPMGVEFKNPMPLLWQHRSGEPIGTVRFDKPTKNGITFEAELPVVEEEGTLRDRIEEAWQSIKLGLVRAVSIGFRPLKWAWIGEYEGIEYQEIEVFELSAVTIPANAEALITDVSSAKGIESVMSVIKSFDEGAPTATGRPIPPRKDPARARAPNNPSERRSAVNLTPKEGKDMKTLAEQIAALEAKRAANEARMEAVMQKSIDEGRSTDEAEQEEFDTLAAEQETIDADLKRLKTLEAMKAKSAKPVDPAIRTGGEAAEARNPAVSIKAPALAPGIAFARVAKCIGMAKGVNPHALQLAQSRFADSAAVVNVLKAAVEAGTTDAGSWAGALVGDESSVYADFVEFLRPQTILGKFGTGGVPALRRVPFRVPLIGQSDGGEGYWVGEGKAKPLTNFDFTRTTLGPLKVANIAVVTDEVLRDSSPSAEMILRDQLAAALRARLDTDFINPAKAAAAGVSPASITNGAEVIASTGTDADAIRLDVRAVFQKFIAANNAPSSGVWIMSSTTALALSLIVNALGQREFPNVGMTGGTFEGLPVIVSDYVGDIVALVNASDVYLADDGGVAIDMSREASLEMDSAPAHDSDTPTPAQLVSLWQTNSVGFRAERTINWARRRTSAVAYLSGVAWGGAVPAS